MPPIRLIAEISEAAFSAGLISNSIRKRAVSTDASEGGDNALISTRRPLLGV
jgi:hypothetical protein